ncbi:MAG: DUF4250 domain-containing protein [Bacteroidales bacterium]|nr:DUF4250 domain-containing protein [Bacteroidales bacterium]
MDLPQDPFMLLSVVNTRLRDDYPSLDEMCAAENIDRDELCRKLGEAGFEYMPAINQFR